MTVRARNPSDDQHTDKETSMTATTVNGLAVVSDEAGVAPFTDRAGNPVVQPQTRVLTLEDGSVVYGCLHCDYISTNKNSVRPHLGKHNSHRRNGNRHLADALSVRDMSLTDLLERLDHLDRTTADRDKWRARALKAERRLSSLRNALGVTVNEPAS